jgi:16S rRNA processing protein RimM
MRELSLRHPVCLAEITSPHGVRGAVKVKIFTAYGEDLFGYPTLRDQAGKVYKLTLFAPKQNDLFVVMVEGISSREEAEALRGVRLYVDRSELPPLPSDEFYYEDLIGLTVVDQSGEKIGTVSTVQNYGAGDFFDIQAEAGDQCTLPFTKEAVPEVNLGAKKIIINPEFLLGVDEPQKQ